VKIFIQVRTFNDADFEVLSKLGPLSLSPVCAEFEVDGLTALSVVNVLKKLSSPMKCIMFWLFVEDHEPDSMEIEGNLLEALKLCDRVCIEA
jgi:hypothetical protein